MLGYLLFVILFYWASGDRLYYVNQYTESVTAKSAAAVMTNGTVVTFPFSADMDYCDYISLLIGTSSRSNPGDLDVELLRGGSVLAHKVLATSALTDYVYDHIMWDQPVKTTPGEPLTVRIMARNVPANYGVSLWYGDSVSAGRFSVKQSDVGSFTVNGKAYQGTVCYKTAGRNSIMAGYFYWPAAVLIGAMIAAYGFYVLHCARTGKSCLASRWLGFRKRYSFLIHQLVSRDFKRKYKRSVLGVFWSFLNPLLTMVVQYIVFSTLFKSSIDNFVVYLLSGIVLYNFFSEAVNMGLTSITDNASLINKVYVPKVIYPYSRTLSAVINLLIALIPLFGAVIFSGCPLNRSLLLLPIGLFLLFVFSLGFALLLATSMVYFRDTLFLWSVVSVLWSYLTPTFYPITIIPKNLQIIFKLNPLYQYITFARSILIEGLAPPPSVYLGCILSAAIMFAVGWAVFRKHQSRFILHL